LLRGDHSAKEFLSNEVMPPDMEKSSAVAARQQTPTMVGVAPY